MQPRYEVGNLRKIQELPGWLKSSLALGGQIRKIRTALGMTQEQLAERSGLAQSIIAEIEGGKRQNLGLFTIQKLAEGLNCKSLVQIIPEKEISQILDGRSTQVAQKIVSISSGSAAIEMQGPSPKAIQDEIREIKKDLLDKHRSRLWQNL